MRGAMLRFEGGPLDGETVQSTFPEDMWPPPKLVAAAFVDELNSVLVQPAPPLDWSVELPPGLSGLLSMYELDGKRTSAMDWVDSPHVIRGATYTFVQEVGAK